MNKLQLLTIGAEKLVPLERKFDAPAENDKLTN